MFIPAIIPDPNPEPCPASRWADYQQLVRGDVCGASSATASKNRNRSRRAKITKVEFTMPDVSTRFARGHRIMVQVQSTWFPLVDRNPQTFCDIYQARAEDFKKATQRVYRTTAAPSAVRVNLLPSGR